MAIITAASSDIDNAADVTARVFRKLGSIESTVSLAELKRLARDLRRILLIEMSVEDPKTLEFLLLPFLLALRLAPLRRRSDDYLAALGRLTNQDWPLRKISA